MALEAVEHIFCEEASNFDNQILLVTEEFL